MALSRPFGPPMRKGGGGAGWRGSPTRVSQIKLVRAPRRRWRHAWGSQPASQAGARTCVREANPAAQLRADVALGRRPRAVGQVSKTEPESSGDSFSLREGFRPFAPSLSPAIPFSCPPHSSNEAGQLARPASPPPPAAALTHSLTRTHIPGLLRFGFGVAAAAAPSRPRGGRQAAHMLTHTRAHVYALPSYCPFCSRRVLRFVPQLFCCGSFFQ